jgi:hypothetical protein
MNQMGGNGVRDCLSFAVAVVFAVAVAVAVAVGIRAGLQPRV